MIVNAKPPRLAKSIKASSLIYSVFWRFESHPGRKASLRCTRSATLCAWGMGTESCSLRAFLLEPQCGTCKKDQSGIQLQDYWSGNPNQNRSKTIVSAKNLCASLHVALQEGEHWGAYIMGLGSPDKKKQTKNRHQVVA